MGIQESPEEAAADVQAKKTEDEQPTTTSHEPSNEETNESKVSPLLGETQPEKNVPEKNESQKDVTKDDGAEGIIADNTVTEESQKDDAAPVAADADSEAQEESKSTDSESKLSADDESESPDVGESKSADSVEPKEPVEYELEIP